MDTKQLITFCIIEKGESNSDYKKHYDEIIKQLQTLEKFKN